MTAKEMHDQLYNMVLGFITDDNDRRDVINAVVQLYAKLISGLPPELAEEVFKHTIDAECHFREMGNKYISALKRVGGSALIKETVREARAEFRRKRDENK